MRADAAAVLLAMGYTDAHFLGHVNRIDWFIPENERPTEAEINAFDMSPQAVATRATAKARDAAKALLTADAPSDKRFKALLLVVLDEINLIRGKLVPALPARAVVQLKAAIAGKIDGGQADG